MYLNPRGILNPPHTLGVARWALIHALRSSLSYMMTLSLSLIIKNQSVSHNKTLPFVEIYFPQNKNKNMFCQEVNLQLGENRLSGISLGAICRLVLLNICFCEISLQVNATVQAIVES